MKRRLKIADDVIIKIPTNYAGTTLSKEKSLGTTLSKEKSLGTTLSQEYQKFNINDTLISSFEIIDHYVYQNGCFGIAL